MILARGCRKALSRWKQRLQSSRARDLAKGLEPKSEGVSDRVDPHLSRGEVREPVLVDLERPPEISKRGGRAGSMTRRQRRCVTRDRSGRKRPTTRSSQIDRSTHGAVKRRPTWLVPPKNRQVLQEPHDTQAARSDQKMGIRWSYASTVEGAGGNIHVGDSTTMAPHEGMHVPHGPSGDVTGCCEAARRRREASCRGARIGVEGGNTQ